VKAARSTSFRQKGCWILVKLIPLHEKHLHDAAVLVSSRYERLREQEPLLPQRYQNASAWLPLLRDVLQTGAPGVAAIREGRLVGFLTAWLMPAFRGKRSVYSPEWANAADLEDRRYLYEEMYGHLATAWVADRFVAHYVTTFANDLDALQAWHWLGFGMAAVDALRGLQPTQGADRPIDVRRAGAQDVEQVIALDDGLRQYAKGSPNFFVAEKYSRATLQAWLGDPGMAIWLAYVDQEPVAFLRIGPADEDVCAIVDDEGTTSIYGAFTRDAARGRGIATALLDRALASARSAGYERCAVSFEPTNLLGTRFWLGQQFKPVCLSLFRHVDERVLQDA
jgi:GNAT superfamily N-acetyltransferase